MSPRAGPSGANASDQLTPDSLQQQQQHLDSMYLRHDASTDWPSGDVTTPERVDDTSVGASNSIPFDPTPREDGTSFSASDIDTDDELEAVRRVRVHHTKT